MRKETEMDRYGSRRIFLFFFLCVSLRLQSEEAARGSLTEETWPTLLPTLGLPMSIDYPHTRNGFRKKKRKKVVAWSSSPNEVPNSRSRLRSAESGVDVLIERRCCCCGGCRQRLLADGTALLSPTPPPSSYFPSTPECSTPQFSKSQSTRHRCITQRAAPKKNIALVVAATKMLLCRPLKAISAVALHLSYLFVTF